MHTYRVVRINNITVPCGRTGHVAIVFQNFSVYGVFQRQCMFCQLKYIFANTMNIFHLYSSFKGRCIFKSTNISLQTYNIQFPQIFFNQNVFGNIKYIFDQHIYFQTVYKFSISMIFQTKKIFLFSLKFFSQHTGFRIKMNVYFSIKDLIFSQLKYI